MLEVRRSKDMNYQDLAIFELGEHHTEKQDNSKQHT